MNKQSMLTILLISAICLLVNAVAGWMLFNLGGLASVVLSIIFVANVQRVFGPEASDARMSCLVNAIVTGAFFVLGSTLGVFLAIFTLGISAILSGGLAFCIGIGFGIWQIVAWNKLNNLVKGTAVSA